MAHDGAVSIGLAHLGRLLESLKENVSFFSFFFLIWHSFSSPPQPTRDFGEGILAVMVVVVMIRNGDNFKSGSFERIWRM